MPEFATERDLGDLMAQKLAASVMSDILDACGFRDQVMGTTIRPLFSQVLVVGRAMPVLSTEVCEVPEKPYQMDIGGVDSLKPDDALVPYAPACAKAAFWGGTLPAAGTVQAALTRADAGYFSAEELKRGILLRQVHATPGALCTTSQCCNKQDR